MAHFEEVSSSLEAIRQRAQSAGYFQLLNLHIDEARDGIGKVSIHVDARLFTIRKCPQEGVSSIEGNRTVSRQIMRQMPRTAFVVEGHIKS